MIEYTPEEKEQAVIDLCSRAVPAKRIADRHGVSCVTLYEWRKQLLGEECSCSKPRRKTYTAKVSENICPDVRYIEDLRAQTDEIIKKARASV